MRGRTRVFLFLPVNWLVANVSSQTVIWVNLFRKYNEVENKYMFLINISVFITC